jgi:TRAP-type C4-dicarboxylate transport system permease small subunit
VLAAKAMTLIAVCLIAYYGSIVFQAGFHIVSQTTGVSTRWIKVSIFAGAILMALFALRCVAADIGRIRRGERTYFENYGQIPGVDAPPRREGNR